MAKKPDKEPDEESPIEDQEVHHLQIIDQYGNVPLTLTIIISRNPNYLKDVHSTVRGGRITPKDVINAHLALEEFNGDFKTLFKRSGQG